MRAQQRAERIALGYDAPVLHPLIFTLAIAATETASASDSLLIGHALAGGTYNPRAGGLFIGLRDHRVYNRSGSALFDNLYFDYGAELLVSASVRPALFVEWSPLAIFKIRLQYEFWTWMGLSLGLGHGLTFASADAPFDEATLEAREGEEELNFGHRLMIAPTLQLKIWRLVLVETFEVAGWFVHGGEEGEYWYDSIDDNLIKKGALDGTMRNTLTVGAILWDGDGDAQLVMAVMHEFLRTMSADFERQRLALLTSYTFADELWGISRPTLVLIGGVVLEDQNREEEFFFQGALRLEMDFD